MLIITFKVILVLLQRKYKRQSSYFVLLRDTLRDKPRKILEKFKRHSSDIFRLSPIKNTECKVCYNKWTFSSLALHFIPYKRNIKICKRVTTPALKSNPRTAFIASNEPSKASPMKVVEWEMTNCGQTQFSALWSCAISFVELKRIALEWGLASRHKKSGRNNQSIKVQIPK